MSTVENAAEVTDRRLSRMMDAMAPGPAPAADGLPPGPHWPALVQSVFLLRFRHVSHRWLFNTYGDAVTLRLLPGRTMVLMRRPEDIREIFTADISVMHAGKGNAILGPVMGEHSLLLLDSMEHQRARRLLMPAFNGRALREYAGVVSQLAAAELASWQPGRTVRSLDRMNALTLSVIMRVVFGVDAAQERGRQLREVLADVVRLKPLVLIGGARPGLRRLGPWRAFRAQQRLLDELIFAEIGRRRRAPDLDQRLDVLSRLIRAGDEDGLSDSELRDELVTLLLAGHETTASALSWTLVELGSDAALQQRAREGGEEFLEAVVKESLRRHPIIPLVARVLTEPATIGGWDLPAGVTVAPSIEAAHRREQAFTQAERFIPERFLGANPAPNTWIPFGGGARRCIGAGFATMEAVAVLREVLERYEVTAVATERPGVRNITSIPRRGGRIRVRALGSPPPPR